MSFPRIAMSVLTLLATPVFAGHSESTSNDRPDQERTMTRHASGTFEVKMAPQGEADDTDGVSLGRMSLDKTFAGDLVATGKGQMLTAMTPVEGSAAYVAIERVSGRLHDRTGSFTLVHRGIMDRGAQELVVRIVPDSGTDALEGIAGEMRIIIAGDEHRYELTYSISGID